MLEPGRGSRLRVEAADDGEGPAFAAGAVERKRAAKRRAEVPLEVGTQTQPRAVHAGLHGLRLESEQLSRFLDTESFDHPGDEHGSEGIRKIVDCAFDEEPDLV